MAIFVKITSGISGFAVAAPNVDGVSSAKLVRVISTSIKGIRRSSIKRAMSVRGSFTVSFIRHRRVGVMASVRFAGLRRANGRIGRVRNRKIWCAIFSCRVTIILCFPRLKIWAVNIRPSGIARKRRVRGQVRITRVA